MSDNAGVPTHHDFEARRAAGNFSWLFVDKASRLVVTVAVNAVLARRLGPEGFGYLSSAVAFCALFGLLATQGLDQLFVRKMVEDASSAGEMVGTAIVMRAAGALLCICAALIVSRCLGGIFADHAGPLVAIISFSYMANSCDFADLWFQSKTMSKWTVFSRQAGLLGAGALRIVFAWKGAPLAAFAAAYVIETWIAACVQCVSFKARGGPRPVFKGSLFKARRLLAEGWPLTACAVVIMIYSKLDQVLLASWRSVSEVGHYGSALRVLDYANVFPMIVSTSIFPMMVRTWKLEARPGWPDRFERVLAWVVWVTWAGTAMMCLLAPWVIFFLYGPRFSEAASLLRVVCWTLPLVFFSVIRHSWLTMTGQLTSALRFELLFGAFSVGLNAILIPRYGAVGAAWAMLLAAGLGNFTGIFLLQPLREPARLYARSLFRPFRRVSI